MQINRTGPILSQIAGFRCQLVAGAALGLALTLAGCDSPAPRAGERQPARPVALAQPMPLPPRAPAQPARPAAPPPPMAPAAAPDWRDVPLPAGEWSWAPRPGGSAARFGLPGQAPLAVLTCERATGVVLLNLPAEPFPGTGPGPHTARITASTSSGIANAAVQPVDGLITITLPASSRLLDAMAFSRGRFRVTIDGAPGNAATVLPSWSEVGRVVEDCRG
jgi:hypothetical protein